MKYDTSLGLSAWIFLIIIAVLALTLVLIHDGIKVFEIGAACEKVYGQEYYWDTEGIEPGYVKCCAPVYVNHLRKDVCQVVPVK